MDRLAMQTPDRAEENFRALAQLFPNAVTESVGRDEEGRPVVRRAIDADVLRQEVAAQVAEGGGERYQFTWPDKRRAVLAANAPVRATLRPCREESAGRDGTPGGFDSENLYIEGDNLEVLKLLRETYLGRVGMIYIDPPYNTGNDFVYEDDFTEDARAYAARSGQYDEAGGRLVQNTERNGRFHTDWLNMMYPRLRAAKDLLSETGAIFISLDDNELRNAIKLCDEVFGESNFVATLIWKSKSGGANDSRFFAVDHEYILVYAKCADKFTVGTDREAAVTTAYNRRDEAGEYALDRLDKQSIRYSPALDYEIKGPDGASYFPKHKDPAHPNATWRWSKKRVAERYDELVFENGCVYTKNYKKAGSIARSLLLDERFGRTRTGKTDCFALFNRDIFSNPKPVKLVRFLAMIAADKDSLILDFFSGSATTAHAVMRLNAEDGGRRKYIMVQLPEETGPDSEAFQAGYPNICEIGKERIRRAGAAIRAETGADADYGFRVLKWASSNMKDVYYTPAETDQMQLAPLADNIKEDRTPEDLLFQVMLDMGVPLSSSIETVELGGKRVFDVGGGFLLACFDENVTEETVTEIAGRKPAHFAMRDSSMANDAVAASFEQIFAAHSPETVRKVV